MNNNNNIGLNQNNDMMNNDHHHQYPSYDADEELISQFIRHHTILVYDNDDDDIDRSDDDGNNENDDDDDMMMIPTEEVEIEDEDEDDDNEDIENQNVNDTQPYRRRRRRTFNRRRNNIRKVNCYKQHLHRIRHRQYYTNNNTSSTSTSTFIIEIPCIELIQYNPIIYTDLVQRISNNVLRYHDLFCTVIDRILNEIPLTTTNSTTTGTNTSSSSSSIHLPRNVEDILYDQRLAIQQQQQQEEAAATAAANNQNQNNEMNPYGNINGPMEQEQDEQQQQAQTNQNITATFPPLLMRRYELRILPNGRYGIYPPFHNQYHKNYNNSNSNDTSNTDKTHSSSTNIIPTLLRNVRAQSIGKIVTITGMVVRISDVKPVIQVASYACDYCGAEIYQLVQHQKEFLPATICPLCSNPNDQQGGQQGQRQRRRPMQRSKGHTLFLQTRGSKFIKYQEMKVQELSHHVPMGHIPRSITVYCYGELTRQTCPGDIITLDGIFLPQKVAESGYRAMKAGLITTTYIQAQHIIVHKKSLDDIPFNNIMNHNGTSSIESMILQIANGPDPIGRLSASIAPEIFGHIDIKRSLLLQLVSGCTRTLPDGMRIRGDINILLMGDPGVAKSQLLKHVASIAPRGVYTTGKGSSGVGLTAAVTRDTTTNEMILEGGALVFADRGICCIDEFDKMDESDRTAIHEVMEQQTVSIAKAGIVATLNARTSVLAAANPIYGRYNPYKSLSDNIALPNSLLSRFDLIFLILDIADVDKDIALAKHVTYVHQMEGEKQNSMNDTTDPKNSENDNDEIEAINDIASSTNINDDVTKPISPLLLREYISRAKQYHPVVPADVAPYIVEAYVALRMQQGQGGGNHNSRVQRNNQNNSNDQTVMTARQLLSTLRLSQALARLRFSNIVAREDVDEAIRLTHMSKASLHTMMEERNNSKKYGHNGNNDSTDTISRIFHILRDYITITKQSSMDVQLCEAMVLRKGYTIQQLHECLTEYESLDIIQYNQTKTQIHFI